MLSSISLCTFPLNEDSKEMSWVPFCVCLNHMCKFNPINPTSDTSCHVLGMSRDK
jgi:hypothetical protein